MIKLPKLITFFSTFSYNFEIRREDNAVITKEQAEEIIRRCAALNAQQPKTESVRAFPFDNSEHRKTIPCDDQPKCETCGKSYKSVDCGYDLKGDRQYRDEPICDCQQPCETCGGSGKIKCKLCASLPFGSGMGAYGKYCNACNGKGEIPCPDCPPATQTGELVKELRIMGTSLKAIEYGVATRIEGLEGLCEAFLQRWKRSGPQGSSQWEKFDSIVARIKAAIGEETK